MKKQGISLIVLVITIIVMIILVAAVVISLNNTGIINKANEAVDKTNEKEVEQLAALVWAEEFMDGKRGNTLKEDVLDRLKDYTDDFNIEVTDTGVSVTNKNSSSLLGLGSLITKDNYGDKVDYTVTVNGTVYDDWQIFYHNNEYVYLIAENSIGDVSLNKGTTVASLTSEELALYEKFRVGTADKYALVEQKSCQAIAQLIKDYAVFANKTTYGINVVGAIGGPTIELLAAGWNAKGYTPTMTLTTNTGGYEINGTAPNINTTSDGLYIPSSYSYRLASPSSSANTYLMFAGYGAVNAYSYDASMAIRPVVCLKSSIPAIVGTGDYDFSLTK